MSSLLSLLLLSILSITSIIVVINQINKNRSNKENNKDSQPIINNNTYNNTYNDTYNNNYNNTYNNTYNDTYNDTYNNTINKNRTEYFPACDSSYTSLVLKSIDVDSSFETRKKIAIRNGILDYSGTASQNIELLDKLKQGLLIKIGDPDISETVIDSKILNISRLAAQAIEGSNDNNLTIITFQYFTDAYKSIIEEKDKSFYDTKFSDLQNFEYVLNRYTGPQFQHLNDYLRKGELSDIFTEAELKSWAYCLHSSLQFRTSNVDEGTIVYRGVNINAPKTWKVGGKFYFGEFVSTSKKISEAEKFANGKTLMVITIKNNGVEGKNNYCRYIEDITQYKGEEEVLITAFSLFKITKIEGYYYYMDCEGY